MSETIPPPLHPSGLTSEARTWAMFCHLAALSFIFTGFGYLLGPLIVWLIKKDEYPFVDENGKESLNFQLSMTIYALISTVLCLVVIGFVLLAVLGILNLVCVIIASVKTMNGERFRYPITIRFLK